MIVSTRRRCLQTVTACPQTPFSISSALLPIFVPSLTRCRSFSRTPARSSRIGAKPLSVPVGVTFNIIPARIQEKRRPRLGQDESHSTVLVTGPLGELPLEIPSFIAVDQSSPKGPVLSVSDRTEAQQRAMWGTIRALLQNNINGVFEGHSAVLRLVGVGYRATIEDKAATVDPEYEGQKFVNLRVGYTHPIELGIPKGVTASTPQPSRILLEGIKKDVVTQFAAEIRRWRKPEPYKGKGIFVNDETIKLKGKKTG